MKNGLKCILIFLFFILASCSDDREITRLLNSNIPNEIIEGAYKAGNSGEKKYVPLLLHDAANGSEGTSLHFARFTVYTEKMFALERILHVKPPHPFGGIKTQPDSVNIRFYVALWQQIHDKENKSY
ncbi:hypothetical protein [uncultured Mucilaginibacter sp.]|uniref:hypothetical protein n=1 Tax=uncultured Mucilaginibacter sp. TaxID=797541 RepID=UPI0025FD9A26|nr:hypothetical protein [uncultured Mucilaginibacter sp.]